MATNWTHRIIIVVSAQDQQKANTIMAQLTGVEADNETFATGLSPSGKTPATHYCCFGSFQDAHSDAIKVWGSSKAVRSSKFYRLDINHRIKEHNGSTLKSVNDDFQIDDTLADLGLQFIETPIIVE